MVMVMISLMTAGIVDIVVPMMAHVEVALIRMLGLLGLLGA